MTEKLVLIGLVEPESEDLVGAFNEWYLGNHVGDTFHCPRVRTARVYKAARGFMGEAPSGYLSIYEFEGSDAADAEAALNAYLADPEAYPDRQPPNGSLKVLGAGWYHEIMHLAPES